MKLLHELRSLTSKSYRRAYRSFRNLPRITYDYVIDAGAHTGTFSDAFLQLHRPKRLIMLEPIPELAGGLKRRYLSKPFITIERLALSDKSGSASFHVNERSAASSLLQIDARNSRWFNRRLLVTETIEAPTISLPEVMQRHALPAIDLLKLDIQGGERLVLQGAEAVLPHIGVIYSEVFFEPLYHGAWLFLDACRYLADHRFKLCGLSNIVHADSGDLLQANAVFRNTLLTGD